MTTVLTLTCPKCKTQHEKKYDAEFIESDDLRRDEKLCPDCREELISKMSEEVETI